MFSNLPKYVNSRENSFWSSRVPDHWVEKPGLAVLEENRAKNTGLRETQVLSLSYGRVVIKPVEMQRGLVPESYETYQVLAPGDVVVRPTDLQNDQSSIRVGHVNDRGIITSAYIGLRPRGDWSDSYAYQYLSVIDSSKHIYGMGSGLRQQLGWDDLKRMPCLVPPADEQAAIVKYLAHANARIDKAIAVKRRLISLLEEQKRSALRDQLSSQERPLWPVGRLGRIGNGSTPARSNSSYWNGNVPWLNSSVVNQDSVHAASQFVTERALAECHLPLVPAGSVLVGITGQGRTRGMSTVLHIPAVINQHIAFIVPDRRRISADFLNLALAAGYSDLRRISDGVGGTKGALTVSDLKSFKVPLPSLEEQRNLLALTHQQRELSDRTQGKARREIVLLQEFRTRLVVDVVTGLVDVRAIAATLGEVPDSSEDAVLAVDDGLEEVLSEGEQ